MIFLKLFYGAKLRFFQEAELLFPFVLSAKQSKDLVQRPFDRLRANGDLRFKYAPLV